MLAMAGIFYTCRLSISSVPNQHNRQTMNHRKVASWRPFLYLFESDVLSRRHVFLSPISRGLVVIAHHFCGCRDISGRATECLFV